VRASARVRRAAPVVVMATLAAWAPAASAKAPASFHDRGILRSVSSARHTLIVHDTNGDPTLRGRDVTLSVTSSTKVSRDGHPVALGALQPGDGLTTTGRIDGRRHLVATVVQATSPPQPDAPSAAVGSTCVSYYTCTPALPAATGGPALTITISNFTFDPPAAVIPVGSLVTVRNTDPAPHTFSGNHLDSGSLATGGSFTVEFTTAGSYRFFCAIHPFMNGVLDVR
jgi:plastocyanin